MLSRTSLRPGTPSVPVLGSRSTLSLYASATGSVEHQTRRLSYALGTEKTCNPMLAVSAAFSCFTVLTVCFLTARRELTLHYDIEILNENLEFSRSLSLLTHLLEQEKDDICSNTLPTKGKSDLQEHLLMTDQQFDKVKAKGLLHSKKLVDQMQNRRAAIETGRNSCDEVIEFYGDLTQQLIELLHVSRSNTMGGIFWSLVKAEDTLLYINDLAANARLIALSLVNEKESSASPIRFIGLNKAIEMLHKVATAGAKFDLELKQAVNYSETLLHELVEANEAVVNSLSTQNPSQGLMSEWINVSMAFTTNLYIRLVINELSVKTSEAEQERKRADLLLTQMLPRSIAKELKMGKKAEPKTFEMATIYFSDIVGFTALSAESTPIETVELLNNLYSTFDEILDRYDVYKVETIGDAYMIASGLPKRNGDKHAEEICTVALEVAMKGASFTIPHRQQATLKIRIGIHSGPCAAGIVGLKMPRYCLFGDTINVASRLESTSLPQRIQISQSTKSIIESLDLFDVVLRGKTYLKGKGDFVTYWLVGRKGFPFIISLNEEDMNTRKESTMSQASAGGEQNEVKTTLENGEVEAIESSQKTISNQEITK